MFVKCKCQILTSLKNSLNSVFLISSPRAVDDLKTMSVPDVGLQAVRVLSLSSFCPDFPEILAGVCLLSGFCPYFLPEDETERSGLSVSLSAAVRPDAD